MEQRYEGFRHDPSWVGSPAPGSLDATVSDLRRLPSALQEAAVLVDSCEAAWPQDLVAAAVNALADLGRPLRHLYYAHLGEGGRRDGVRQLANALEDDVEVTRKLMLDAVRDLPTGETGYVVWAQRGVE